MSTENSTRQWKRRAQIVLGKAGKGLLVENLRMQIEVTKTIDPAPNVGIIKIYNLAPDNEARIRQEFDELLVNVGYEGAMRLVFRGNIKHVYRYREGNDTITEIEAADGDKDYRTAVMNETLAAGTTNKQIVQRAVGSFKGGTGQGAVQVEEKPRIRGRVISGSTRDVLGDVARDSGAHWSIQDGQLVIVKAGALLPGEAVLIRPDTGMIGPAEVNEHGVTVKCLLNPQVRVGGAVKLDSSSIKAKIPKVGKVEKTGDRVIQDDGTRPGVARLSADGIYKVVKIQHKGDTHGAGGGDWITESLCVAI